MEITSMNNEAPYGYHPCGRKRRVPLKKEPFKIGDQACCAICNKQSTIELIKPNGRRVDSNGKTWQNKALCHTCAQREWKAKGRTNTPKIKIVKVKPVKQAKPIKPEIPIEISQGEVWEKVVKAERYAKVWGLLSKKLLLHTAHRGKLRKFLKTRKHAMIVEDNFSTPRVYTVNSGEVYSEKKRSYTITKEERCYHIDKDGKQCYNVGAYFSGYCDKCREGKGMDEKGIVFIPEEKSYPFRADGSWIYIDSIDGKDYLGTS